MLAKMNKSMPIWFYLGILWMLLPEPSIGLAGVNSNQPVISEQLKIKLDKLADSQEKCHINRLCNKGLKSVSQVKSNKAAALTLLAGLTVR